MAGEVFYDDSLPIAIETVGRHIEATADVVYLRDGQGQLHIFVATGTDQAVITALDADLRERLAGYVPSFGAILHEGEPSSPPVLLVVGGQRVKYIERRFTGADWTLSPAPLVQAPPRLVFYSIKGGVGRTTALTVLAAQIASRGGSVLCLDLDLEAPGLGQALLPADQTPEFGALDWLAERAIQGAMGNLPKISDLVGVSPVARNSGRVDVIPAFGLRCLNTPGTVLGKLSRCLIEGSEDGAMVTFGTRVSELIDKACEARAYDAVLVDARAGLSEISAAPLLGLGADILLFMADSNQSFATYAALLTYLQRFAPAEADVEADDWRLRLKTVRGRVANPADALASTRFLDRIANVFADSLYDAEGDDGDLEAFNFAPDDVDAPHFPVPIAFDPRFQTYEPLEFPDQANPEVAEAAFGAFTRWCIERLGLFQDQ
jgi:CO dehydrogenase nickel-insertion accessory protein CooC1